MLIRFCTQRAERSSSSDSVYPTLPVLGSGTLAVDSVVYFYHVIALLSNFRDILSLNMFLNPRNYWANGKSGRNKNLFYEAVMLFSFQSSKD